MTADCRRYLITTREGIMTRRRTTSLTRTLRVAADLWAGADQEELAANPEYVKGQVDLMANLFGIDHDLVEDALRDTIAYPFLAGGWKVAKSGHDPETPWTVTHPEWESLCGNSDAASIEGGQFVSQAEAMSAAWDAIRDAAWHRCDGCTPA